MKTAIFNGKGNITVEERPKPTISEPTNAIVRVVLACVCGSDLWFYRGISDLPHGSVGHEFIGVVDEIGADVHDVEVGDFVISPFSWSDGTCKNCEAGFHTACVHVGFFGQGGEGDGGQEQAVAQALHERGAVGEQGTEDGDGQSAAELPAGVEDAAGYAGGLRRYVVEQDRGHRRHGERPAEADQHHHE